MAHHLVCTPANEMVQRDKEESALSFNVKAQKLHKSFLITSHWPEVCRMATPGFKVNLGKEAFILSSDALRYKAGLFFFFFNEEEINIGGNLAVSFLFFTC